MLSLSTIGVRGFGLGFLFSISISSVSLISEAPEAEDDYVKVYGNNPHKSGKWKPFSRTRNSYPDIMKNVSVQAHQLAGFGPPTASVRSAFFGRNRLMFLCGKYKTVTLDYIVYGLGIGNTDFVIHYLWYITKGLREDCIYYLDKIDSRGMDFRLTNIHICGIRIPEWPKGVIYNDSSAAWGVD